MAELFRVRLDEAIAEVERELDVRRPFYAERVRLNKMPRLTANRQIVRMEAARDFLKELLAVKGETYVGDGQHD